uniref:Uncharacterized protein n=1 Tax=Cucumis sativus TaxID=3659 RepID=A0A0A0LM63_CUCSA
MSLNVYSSEFAKKYSVVLPGDSKPPLFISSSTLFIFFLSIPSLSSSFSSISLPFHRQIHLPLCRFIRILIHFLSPILVVSFLKCYVKSTDSSVAQTRVCVNLHIVIEIRLLKQMGEVVPIYYSIIAFFCTAGAIALAIFHIYRHLLNYTEPTYQRYIVRIIFMVPVYALMSFLSLVLPSSSIYFNSIREVYEAWVIYNFLSLCLAWVGGPGAVVISLSGRVLKPSCCLMTCCLPPLALDG